MKLSLIALFSALLLCGQTKAPQPAVPASQASKPLPPEPKAVPLPKDIASDLDILNMAYRAAQADYEAAQAKLQGKFETLRQAACKSAGFSDCEFARDPSGATVIREKPAVDMKTAAKNP